MRVFMYQNESECYTGRGAVVVARDLDHALELFGETTYAYRATAADVVEVDLSQAGTVMEYCYG